MTRKLLLSFLLALALFSGAASDAAAQFGQNKVHYKKFAWKILRTEHFDIHYYEGTEDAVQHAALMAERGYKRLSGVLHHQIRSRIPLVLYASHTDFEQTNITPELISIGTGGVTEFLKRRVFLPFTGSFAELDHVLTHELVHAFQVDVLFGDTAGVIGNPFASSPPLWFMEGMAEYLSVGGVDANTKMWLRDASLEGYLIPIRTLQYVGDIRVYRFGQSIMQFIADTYGVAKVGELLKRTRRLGNVERALESTTGLTLETLSKKWQEAVRKEYLPQIADYDRAESIASSLTDSERDLSNFNLAVSLSPTGTQMVFISDRSMYNDVYLASAIDGKVFKKLVSGERTGSFETLRFFNTSIAWAPDESQIALPAKAGAEDAIYLIEVPSGKVRKKLRFGLDAIYSPAWSPNGDQLAFVGIERGLSSLRVASVDGSGEEVLLSGLHAVRDPAWSPDGGKIAFLTDQGEGTDVSRLVFAPLRVAIYDRATRTVTVPPGQLGLNTSPQWSPDGKSILFVSDRTGIANLYRLDLDTGRSVRLTNLLSGISGLVAESPAVSVSRDGKRVAFTAFHRGGWDIYSVRDPQRLFQEPASTITADASAPTPPERVFASIGMADTPATSVTTAERYGAAAPDSAARGVAADTAAVDTTLAHYIRAAYREPLADSTTFLRLPYKARFSRDYIAGSALFASNVGFAGSSAISFSDVLGNHNLLAVLNLYGDLRESDVYLAYTNLTKRTNWGGALFQYRIGRLLLSTSDTDDVEDQIYRGGAIFFSRPFTRFRRFEFGSEAAVIDERVLRYNYATGTVSELADEGNSFYVAPYVALVADNALYGSTGPINGGRSRYSVEHAVGDITYTTGILDWRRYTNVRHRFALAQRFIAGASVGRDPQIFRFGGPFTFRGVDYGDLRGTRLLIGNLEFRFPLIEQLGLGWPLPLTLGGINGVVFLEGATAWEEGHDPKFFTSAGGVRTENLHLAFGAGARVNLGYFILRYDFGREHRLEGGLGAPQHFVSFGADF
jgi:Tol biopolymer transport system component